MNGFHLAHFLYLNMHTIGKFYIKKYLNKSFSNVAVPKANKDKAKRVCIVGAGPAGFYAAQHILKHVNDCYVDVFEKLPVPFGLVRYGVAPDHPEVKNVINTFTKTATNPRFRFFGNVCLGKDITLQQLRNDYHAVLLSYGADKDREMVIPNEQQSNVISARDFVAWYNGFPGAQSLIPNLQINNVVIVGQGNVAIDVARMLLTSIDNLRKTDTTAYALAALAESQVRRVHLVGRRGPLQAAFTIKELREVLKLPQVRTIWRPSDFIGIGEQINNLQRPRKRLTELMLKSLSEQHIATSDNKCKEFLPVFQRSPKIIYEHEMEFTVTCLENNSAVPTDSTERLPAELVMRSIGYKSTCVDGDICFDSNSGRVYNSNGRVYKDVTAQSIDSGLYVAGWLGTGPTGVILSTMNSAFAVAQSICSDLESGNLDTHLSKTGVNMNGLRYVSWEGWQRIDAAEIAEGAKAGKPREKIVDVEQMLRAAGV